MSEKRADGALSTAPGSILITYYSSTGFTKKYAQWLAADLDASICPLNELKSVDLSKYKTLIFGSCLRAGSIKDLSKFMRAAKKTACRVLVFFTGSMDFEDLKNSGVLEKNAAKAKIPVSSVFYCPGGLDFEHMEPMHKKMVEFYLNMLKKKRNKSEAEEELFKLDTISFDATDKKYIAPIIKAALSE